MSKITEKQVYDSLVVALAKNSHEFSKAYIELVEAETIDNLIKIELLKKDRILLDDLMYQLQHDSLEQLFEDDLILLNKYENDYVVKTINVNEFYIEQTEIKNKLLNSIKRWKIQNEKQAPEFIKMNEYHLISKYTNIFKINKEIIELCNKI